MNVRHNYVAPIHPTCEIPNNVTNVDVSVPFKRHKGQKLLLDTKKSKIKVSEEGENDIYDVPSEIREERTINDDNTSTINGDDIIEHTRHYRKHEALRVKPDFHDVQLITHPGDLKKCPGTSNTYCKDQNFIANSCAHSYTTPMGRNMYGLRQKPISWNDARRHVMNEYFSKTHVVPDGNGCSYNSAYMIIRPSRYC